MKRFLSLCIIFLSLHYTVLAQVTSINPGTAYQGQSLRTTITSSSLFLTGSSPQGNIEDIFLKNATDSLFATSDSTRVVNASTANTFWAIPNNIATGIYDLVVRLYNAVTHTRTDYQLTNSFTITPSTDTLRAISPDHGYQGQQVRTIISSSSLFGSGRQVLGLTLSNGSRFFQAWHDSTRVINADSVFALWNIPGNAPTGSYHLIAFIHDAVTHTYFSDSLFNCFTVTTSLGLITSIAPDTAYVGQALHTTITSSSLFMSGSSPQGNIQDIILKNATDSFFAISDSTNVTSANAVNTFWTIPANISTGLYQLIVRIYNYLTNTYTDYSLPNAMSIVNAAATVSGTVYDDLNRNGARDNGEPGLKGYTIRLSNTGNTAISDSNGNYLLGTVPGTDTVTLIKPVDDIYTNVNAGWQVLNIINGANAGANFGLSLSRFLISISPNSEIAGHTFSAVILDSNVTQNSTLVSVVLQGRSGFWTYADTMAIADSAHIHSKFTIPPYWAAGKYDLLVTMKNVINNHTRTFRLDTAVNIRGPVGMISGYAYYDVNGNGVKDAGEPGQAGRSIYYYGISSYSTVTDSNGYYVFYTVPNGAYQLAIYNPYSYYSSCGPGGQVYSPSSHSCTVADDTLHDQNFGSDQPASSDYNLWISPSWNNAIPGFDRYYRIYYGNNSGVAVPNAVITFVYDSTLTLQYSSMTPSSNNTATHTLTWNLGTVAGSSSWSYISLSMLVPATDTAGTLLSSVFTIDPLIADCNTADNTVSDISPVTSSRDPNEKHARPYGNLTNNRDSVIHYTINFQNTGNAPTHFVIVKDTLDSNLDPKTVIPTGASSGYRFDNNSGILTFTFDPLVLTDSAADEPHSHGSVSFMVKLKPNLPIGTLIRNTANIYFDYNQPVNTTTAVNTISRALGVKNLSASDKVLISPNPFTESTTISFNNPAHDKHMLIIYDMQGHLVRSFETTDAQFEIDRSEMASGVYIYRLTNQKTKVSLQGKISAQ